ncbi:hypothetical protein Tco_1412450 [Tanacetum coccineum]
MENNKSIDRSVLQKNLYKALVDAYESDKDIFASYGDSVTLKRRRDDGDEDEEPFTGSNRGSKRRRARKETESTSAPKEKTSKSTGRSKEGTLTRIEDPRESFNELMETPLDFSAFVLNRLKVDTLTLELLAGPTFELMKGSCKSLLELEYFLEEVCKATTDQLDWNNPEGQESARDVYSRHRILTVTKLKIVEWHNYKHLEWITIRRDDDKLYTFKEGDYKRLCLQDIEDMLLPLVQGKLTNLNIEEHLALGVSLRMFTRSIVIRRRTPYTTYSNPKGIIYHNKDKKNRLMRIDELHKFSDGTLNDVQSALDDILKRIRMEYLP